MPVQPVDYSNRLEIALEINTDLGEGPIWNAADQTLVFIDCYRGRIYRFDPVDGTHSYFDVGRTIGVAIPRARGGFVVSSADGLMALAGPEAEPALLVPIEPDLPGNRMNDGKCDARGRLWSGTFSTTFKRGAGSLYRIDPDLSASRVVEGVRVSNGIAWSPDDRLLYFNDTLSGGIDVFDYDIARGEVSNKRRFVSIETQAGLPDGMSVDVEGCVWVALYYGSQVRRYSPEGEWIGTIDLPVSRVTSCNFGGPLLDELYISTSDHRLHDDGRPHEPEGGYLFRCRPGVRGLPSHPFRG